MTDILLATDADWVAREVAGALGDAETTLRLVRAGQDVRPAVERQAPDLVILDLQIGNMGGMAAALDLHLEADAGRLPRVPILMLLDRSADVYLAQQSAADSWLIKPVDALRLRRAAHSLLEGDTVQEGVAASTP
jgi:DNA-binding response OmpR family regulator